MKMNVVTDSDDRTVVVSFTLAKIEDVNGAISVIRGAARAMWPEIAFGDGGDCPGKEPGAATAQGRRTRDWSRPPKPGSVSERIVEAVQRLGTRDPATIADEVVLGTGVAAMLLNNLARGGHLP